VRAVVAALLGGVLAVSGAAPVAAVGSLPAAGESEAGSGASASATVPGYRSTWSAVTRDMPSLTAYRDGLTEQRRTYRALGADLQEQLEQATATLTALRERLAVLEERDAQLTVEHATTTELRVAQRELVGGLARLLYQQPSPQLHAVAQLLEGEDLRAFERQDLVTDVLESKAAELAATVARLEQLVRDLTANRGAMAATEQGIRAADAKRVEAATGIGRVDRALAAIDADLGKAQAAIDEIRRAEEERIRAAAAAAAAAAAKAAADARTAAPAPQPRAATPTGGGTPARGSGDFSARLPLSIPYRDTFLTYGLRYRVEPALLAAIAYQESGFDPWAGCSRSGAGKGIMQHEGQSQYCGPHAVAASIEKSAKMLASYYNRSNSWTAAIFAYNNGPGLMDEWIRYSSNRTRLLAVLADYYNASPWASGPTGGYATWGEWRAAVAYSYASPEPLPGFRSATQKWLIYRQG
jgi:hypothetical protein